MRGVSSPTSCATGVADDGSPVRLARLHDGAREHGVEILAQLHLLQRRPDLPGHLAGRREARVDRRRQRAVHDRDERGRHVRAQRAQRLDHAVAQPTVGLVVGRAVEQLAPDQGLPQHRADRELVARRERPVSPDDLGREIRHLALHDARLGRFLRPIRREREPEVDELHHPARRQEDVVRRHVAVDHRQRQAIRSEPLVRRREPAQHADRDGSDELPAGGLVPRHVPADPGAEIDAVDPLEHHVVVLAVVDEVVDLGDVRRLEQRADASLLHEHRHIGRLR